MAARMEEEIDSKTFLACIDCGAVVMRVSYSFEKRKCADDELMVTICYTCDMGDKTKGAVHDTPTIKHINHLMITTWYVYQALTKLVKGPLLVKGDSIDKVPIIHRDKFIHDRTDKYELTTVIVPPDDPQDAIACECPHLTTGIF